MTCPRRPSGAWDWHGKRATGTALDRCLHRAAVEVIERSAIRQARIVTDLAEWFRLSEGRVHLDVKTIDLWAVVARAVENVAAAAKSNESSVSCRFADQPVLIFGDAQQMEAVIRHLIAAARHRGFLRQSVFVTVERQEVLRAWR